MPAVGTGVGVCFTPGNVILPTPATDAAVMWVDMKLGHYTTVDLGGGSFAVSAVTDESWNGHNWSQGTANARPTLGTAGPSGTASLDFDNNNDGYAVAGDLGAGTDHTLIVAASMNNLPQATHANGCFVQLHAGPPYFCANPGNTADSHAGVVTAGGTWNASSLVSPTGGNHVWAWVIDGATGKARCYVDGVAAAADVNCSAFSFGVNMWIGQIHANYAPDGKINKVAYWNSKLGAAALARQFAWAAR